MLLFSMIHAIGRAERTPLSERNLEAPFCYVRGGTRAALYVSRDHGKTWQDTTLVPQFEGAEREEIGGAGYLMSYWMGRHHGFIDEQTTTAEWWK